MVTLTSFETFDRSSDMATHLAVDLSLPVIEWLLIDEQTEFKLTLLSKIFYGEPDYADLIADFNQLLNPLDVSIGQVIRIPDISSLINTLSIRSIYQTTATKPISSSSVLLSNKSKFSINNGVIVF